MSLGYPEAAAWDLLARGASTARMVRLLAAIWAISERGAAEQLEALLVQWRHRGWLEESAHVGG
ncbi:MAG: PqqD family protein [Vicinamibacteria bacterium]|nr:PqqD family protein [Vicinamibacteria bacterium]